MHHLQQTLKLRRGRPAAQADRDEDVVIGPEEGEVLGVEAERC